MLNFKKLQIKANNFIANKNKEYVLKKLEEYYSATNYDAKIRAKEFAIYAFWLAKKQGRLDSLNRIKKINLNKTL